MKYKTKGLFLLLFIIVISGCVDPLVTVTEHDSLLHEYINLEQGIEENTDHELQTDNHQDIIHSSMQSESDKTIIVKKSESSLPITEKSDIQKKSTPQESQKYSGEKISLDFFDIDIKNVFHLISEISRKNLAIDNDVKGKVTLKIDKPVPWDQVLALILKMNNLGMILENDIIRIAKIQTIKNEREIQRAAKELEPLITEYISVNYANAKIDVMPHILLTPKRGSITVDERNNQIIIKDTLEIVNQARETVKRIDMVTPQVMIEARIVEAIESFSREIGTTLSSSGTITDPDTDNILGSTGTSYSLSATNPPLASLGNIGLIFTRASGIPFSTISAQIDASQSKGLLTIISAPKILTLSNKTAIIKQGVKYPLTMLDESGNTTTTFQDVALELEVTPHVTLDERIALTIKISNNEIGAVINNQTSFTTKETSTELLINNGDTVIIGGIKKTIKDTSDSGIPGLKNIPIIGWLFGKKTKSQTKTELLIFITPEIVQLEQRY